MQDVLPSHHTVDARKFLGGVDEQQQLWHEARSIDRLLLYAPPRGMWNSVLGSCGRLQVVVG